MASYSLRIKSSAGREIDGLPTKKLRRQVVDRIRRLADDPRPAGCRKLTEAERYRVRQGPYRVVYEIDEGDRAVTVVRVRHRRDVYRA